MDKLSESEAMATAVAGTGWATDTDPPEPKAKICPFMMHDVGLVNWHCRREECQMCGLKR